MDAQQVLVRVPSAWLAISLLQVRAGLRGLLSFRGVDSCTYLLSLHAARRRSATRLERKRQSLTQF